MKLLIILLCKGACAHVAPPFQRAGGHCPVMHPRSGVPAGYTLFVKILILFISKKVRLIQCLIVASDKIRKKYVYKYKLTFFRSYSV